MASWISIGVALAMTAQVAAQSPKTAAPPPAISTAEAGAIASGWALIAEGKYAEAVTIAAKLLAQSPRNREALVLSVEAEIGRAGAMSGLTAYERWLGARTIDEPGVLRRIARAVLHEWAWQQADPLVRLEGLKALVREGDVQAAQVMMTAVGAGRVGELRALASLGNPDAVDRVAGRMQAAQGVSKLPEIATLADSGSDRAVTPLVEALADPMPQVRAAAADALGTLGRAGAMSALKPLMNDANLSVRLSAAAALYRLGDFSGAELLKGPDFAGSPHPAVRRSAAILMASQPDEAWKAMTRSLLAHPDPTFRLDAAKLLAPYEPETSRTVLEGLAADPNSEVRELAGVALADVQTTSFTMLRQLLRTGTARVKVGAADRVLMLTR